MKLFLAGTSFFLFFLWSCSQSTPGADTGQNSLAVAGEEVFAAKPPPVAYMAPRYDLDYVMGKFEPSEHADFIRIEARYADRSDRYMHREAYEAFVRMHDAAASEGIVLKIISAARSFQYQKGIWEKKWTGERLVNGKDLSKTLPDPVARARKILEYSSMPGSSRHHWGTDIDINSLENSYFNNGKGLKEYNWLKEHAYGYGFCQVYTEFGETRSTGYFAEKWHWSYIPLARELTDLAESELRDEMLCGFKGDEATRGIGIVKNYVLGIDVECR